MILSLSIRESRRLVATSIEQHFYISSLVVEILMDCSVTFDALVAEMTNVNPLYSVRRRHMSTINDTTALV